MRYVILRDDDTNALTPFECLETLYRPFLDRELPVNLAVIPSVRTDVTFPDGRPEGYLTAMPGDVPPAVPVSMNPELVRYLKANTGYHVVQHGCHHEPAEFDKPDAEDIHRRLKQGISLLTEVGFPPPKTFVAPYDKFSRVALDEAARLFNVISTGWFELRRLPARWWPKYAWKKVLRRDYWRAGHTMLLSHPGCLLSYQRPYNTMLEQIKKTVERHRVTVLVTHWWEYFRNNRPDEAFIGVLHQTAEYLASDEDIRVIAFDDLAAGRLPR